MRARFFALAIIVLAALVLGACAAGRSPADALSDAETSIEADAPVVADVAEETTPACVPVAPLAVVFGGKSVYSEHSLPVEVRNCSTTTDLAVTRIDLQNGVERCDGSFCVHLPDEAGADVSAATPLVLLPGASVVVTVVFKPTHEAALDVHGQPVLETTTLLLELNADVTDLEVQVNGFGVPDDCPVAVIHVEEGGKVVPQTVLHLHGENSYEDSVGIVRYAWSVEGPADAETTLVPTAEYPSPTLKVTMLGTYVLHLDVWDEFDRKSCFAAEAEVQVVPAGAIRVELSWESPGALNPDDLDPLSRTDLDLHFAHPSASQPDLDGDGATDPWFDEQWDCFWSNPDPTWGSIGATDDDPHGTPANGDNPNPETLVLDIPEDGKAYAIGVNFWDDYGFGLARAAVRVYVYDTLVYEEGPVELVEHDLWWVGSISWPEGNVTPKRTADGQRWITADYHHADFYQP